MHRTLAAICRRHGDRLSVEPVTVADPGPGQVAVDVAAAAICHSDITYADGGWGGPTPAIYGHEAAGTVAAVGDGVVDLVQGQRVVVGLLRACGDCYHCVRGEEHLCIGTFDDASPFTDAAGQPVEQGLRTGAFSGRTVVHRSQVVAVPDSIPATAAALLACGVLTGFGSVVNTARMPPGSSAAVVGLGGVGLGVVQGARHAGARQIIGVDLNREKLAASRSFGVTDGVDAGDDPVAAVRALTGGIGPDHVYVAVGAKAAIEQGMAMARRGGTVVLVGMPASGVLTEIEVAEFADAAQTIVGSKMGSASLARDVPVLIELYRSGSVLLDEMISGTFALSEINEAIAEVRSGTVLRNVILMATP